MATQLDSDSSDSTIIIDEGDSSECEAYFPSESEEDSSDDAVTPTVFTPNTDATTPRELELIKIAPILISKCCSKECLLYLTASDVMKFRQQFNVLNQTDQRKWLTDRMYENSSCHGGQLVVKFILSGVEICKLAWCKVLSVSNKRITTILDSMMKGQVRKHCIDIVCSRSHYIECIG